MMVEQMSLFLNMLNVVKVGIARTTNVVAMVNVMLNGRITMLKGNMEFLPIFALNAHQHQMKVILDMFYQMECV
jgi:hypothetical protein